MFLKFSSELFGFSANSSHVKHCCTDERLTAEEMDEQRIQNVAYQYLCRLEEAKR